MEHIYFSSCFIPFFLSFFLSSSLIPDGPRSLALTPSSPRRGEEKVRASDLGPSENQAIFLPFWQELPPTGPFQSSFKALGRQSFSQNRLLKLENNVSVCDIHIQAGIFCTERRIQNNNRTGALVQELSVRQVRTEGPPVQSRNLAKRKWRELVEKSDCPFYHVYQFYKASKLLYLYLYYLKEFFWIRKSN